MGRLAHVICILRIINCGAGLPGGSLPELADTATARTAKESAIPECLGLIAVVGNQRDILSSHACYVRLCGRLNRITRCIEYPSLQLAAAGATNVPVSHTNLLSS